jgi:hypothetical protein
MARPKSPKKLNAVKPAATPVTDNTIPAAPVSENAAALSTGPLATDATIASPSESKANTAPKKKAPASGPAIGKIGIVKTDARATVLPINLEEEIRRLAYLFSERRGFEPGHEAEDWLAAETEVRQRYHQQRSAASA